MVGGEPQDTPLYGEAFEAAKNLVILGAGLEI
jgi:hypothetical protein